MSFPALVLALVSIIFIEIALSIDNAILLSSFASNLHTKRLQKLSLVAGLLLAFTFRFLLIYYLDIIFSNPLVQIVGGSYLIFLALKHIYALFWAKKEKEKRGVLTHSFLFTVLKIEICDLIFATDSILAAFTLVYSASLSSIHTNALYLIFFGSIIGMILIRIASIFLLPLIRKQIFLKTSAHLMIGWVGIKMVIETMLPHNIRVHSLTESFFWAGLLLAFLGGLILKKRASRI